MYSTKFKTKLSYTLYTLLVAVLFTACGTQFPGHTVAIGNQNCIVYKIEKIDEPKYGTFKYAVTDATGVGWTLYTFEQYQIGDTLKISK